MSLTKKIAAMLLVVGLTGTAFGDAQWVGGSSGDLWSDANNWDPAAVPASATDQGTMSDPDANVARMSMDGTVALIDSTVDAVAFGLQIGHPKGGAFGNQSASNVLNMTGGTLTQQGNFLLNVGRGTNVDPAHLAQFNVSGGVVNSAGITVPEGFAPGLGSVGLNAEMHVSGNAVVNTDLLRLGAADANSVVTISDNAQVNLTDDNNGFAPGVLWIEAFESPAVGTSLLDIRDNAVLTIHGEWWTDEDGDGMRGAATQSEADYFVDNYVAAGWIVADGGASVLDVSFDAGVITMRAVPEPATWGLMALILPFMLRFRKRS
jgi:hypothetical protein